MVPDEQPAGEGDRVGEVPRIPDPPGAARDLRRPASGAGVQHDGGGEEGRRGLLAEKRDRVAQHGPPGFSRAVKEQEKDAEESRDQLGAPDDAGDRFGVDGEDGEEQGRGEAARFRLAEAAPEPVQGAADQNVQQEIDGVEPLRLHRVETDQGVEPAVRGEGPDGQRAVARRGAQQSRVGAGPDVDDREGIEGDRVLGDELDVIVDRRV
jgi:hypothetical protein